jgi:hypothetical protein
MPALTPYSMGIAPLAPSLDTVAASLPSPCHTELSEDFTGARIQYARCEPRQAPATTTAAPCRTFLPMQVPVEVQVFGGTVKQLHSEPDRVAFLEQNRAEAFWIELLDAVRPVGGCPKAQRTGDVPSEVEARMSCLGIGNRAPEGSDSPVSPSPDVPVNGPQPHDAGGKGRLSGFHMAQSLALPSTHLPRDTYAPGTMAALEYDLGWRALSPSWQAVMPHVDEASWLANPNPELFCAVGRAVLPHLSTDAQGGLLDDATVRIVSFHMHAGGLADCLSDATRSVERTDAEGQPKTVAAIELMDFVRDCAGPKWREWLATLPGEDGLTRRREACEAMGSTAPVTPLVASGEVTPSDAGVATPRTLADTDDSVERAESDAVSMPRERFSR